MAESQWRNNRKAALEAPNAIVEGKSISCIEAAPLSLGSNMVMEML